MTEQQILKGCRKGDPAAQAELYDRYHKELFGICLRYASSESEAKFFLQDTFLQIYKYLFKNRPKGDLGIWMRSAAVDVALQHLKNKRPLFPYIEFDETAEYYLIDQEEKFASGNWGKTMVQMMHQLPAGYRAVFNLHVIEGFNHRQIEEQMGITYQTSKLQLSRAKAALKYLLEEKFYNHF